MNPITYVLKMSLFFDERIFSPFSPFMVAKAKHPIDAVFWHPSFGLDDGCRRNPRTGNSDASEKPKMTSNYIDYQGIAKREYAAKLKSQKESILILKTEWPAVKSFLSKWKEGLNLLCNLVKIHPNQEEIKEIAKFVCMIEDMKLYNKANFDGVVYEKDAIREKASVFFQRIFSRAKANADSLSDSDKTFINEIYKQVVKIRIF